MDYSRDAEKQAYHDVTNGGDKAPVEELDMRERKSSIVLQEGGDLYGDIHTAESELLRYALFHQSQITDLFKKSTATYHVA